jgi:hypothetical protein
MSKKKKKAKKVRKARKAAVAARKKVAAAARKKKGPAKRVALGELKMSAMRTKAEASGRKLGKPLFRFKEEWRPLTTAEAEAYILTPSGIWERKHSPKHVEDLATYGERGTMRWDEVTIDVAKCLWDGGKLVKLNGQHTCRMRLLFPAGAKFPKVRFRTWLVRTDDELRKLFQQFDRNRVRTPGVIREAGLVGTPEFADLSKGEISKLSAGFRFLALDEGSPLDVDANDPEASAEDMRRRFLPESLRVASFLADAAVHAGSKCNPFSRSPVVGAMFETVLADADMAGAFWDTVLTGLNIKSANDPRGRARSYLLGHVLTIAGGKDDERDPSSQHVMFNVCVAMFNAFAAGESASKKAVKEAMKERAKLRVAVPG